MDDLWESLGTEGSEDCQWDNPPPDILLSIVMMLDSDDVVNMLLTSKHWNHGIKLYLPYLSPAHLSQTTGAPIANLKTLHAPLNRSKHSGSITYLAPIRSVSWVTQFTTLANLDLSGQHLDPPGIHTIASCLPSLQNLNLNSCALDSHHLTQALELLPNLTQLSLGGVQINLHPLEQTTLPPSTASPSPPPLHPLVTTLGNLHHLASLDLDAKTFLVQSSTSSANSTHAAFTHNIHSLPLLHQVPALTSLSRLTRLSALSNRISAADLTALGRLTTLRQLHISLFLSDSRVQVRATHLSLLSPLRGLTHLHIAMHGGNLHELAALPLLPHLSYLHVTGCQVLMVGLSVMQLTTLTHLDLSDAGPEISLDLLLQLAASLPQLSTLCLNRVHCTCDFEYVGDALVRGLAVAAPQLRRLEVAGVNLHGTGFHTPYPPTLFPHLTSLTINAYYLLRSCYQDIARLTSLVSLSLMNFDPRGELEFASRLGCFTPFSSLTSLTSLIITNSNPRHIPHNSATPPSRREPDLQFLRTLPLRTLHLSPVTDCGLCFKYIHRVTALRSLTMSGQIEMDRHGLVALTSSTMPSLISLSLSGLIWSSPSCPLCDRLVTSLPATYPNLRQLRLGSLEALSTIALKKCLQGFKKLSYVELGQMEIREQDLREALQPFTQLKYVAASLKGCKPNEVSWAPEGGVLKPVLP